MRYSIRIVEGAEKGKEYVIGSGDWVVGRLKESNIMLESAKISKKHCAFYIQGGLLFLKDLKSSNGIFVNGKKVENAQLNHGDTIVIGDTVFVTIKGSK